MNNHKNALHSFIGLMFFGVLCAMLFPDNLALFSHIFSIAFLVLALDLVTGYSGVATLGHAALFGTGAYAAGIASAHYQIQDPILMTFIALSAGAIAGFISGLLILRAKALAQLVLTIALVHIFHEIANKASSWTGGSDGLSSIEVSPLLGIYEFDLWGKTAYYYGLALLIICFIFLLYLMRSPFGLLCRAIKQDSLRIEALGIAPMRYRLIIFTISGAVAAIGGALSAISTQVVGLNSLSFDLSAQALIMLILGGAGSLYGALIGAIVYLLLEYFISAVNPFYWLAIMGALLIITVIFAPKGLYGLIQSVGHKIKRRSR